MKTEEKRQLIFDSLTNILQAIGSFEADRKCKFEFVKEPENDREYIKYSSVYGSYEQETTHDSAIAFFEDTLKLLLLRCREMKDTKEVIDEYFNNFGNREEN